MSTAFGVHVGNSSACIAVSKEGKTDVVANDAGDRVTPAVVSFTDTEIVVGLAAKQGRIRNPTNTITDNKLLIGGGDGKDSPVSLVPQEDGSLVYQVDFEEKDYMIAPGQVLRHIYAYMHDIAASHCANVDASNTVVSVPRHFTQQQRELVKQAASEAGFTVVQVVNEPVASCLAHGLEQDQERKHVLVYRVGGSSMTASILLVSGGSYSILDSSEFRLGGNAVTEAVANYIGREFKNKYKEDLMVNKRARAKLFQEGEKTKHVLSTLDTAHCYIESLYDGMDFSTNVTRARFDNELSKVVGELMAPISDLLTRCSLCTDDISNVVLAGGTTKVVKIQKQLSSMFPKAEMNLNISPDESIAIGAAVQASYLTKELSLTSPTVKMMSISQNILALSDALEGGQTVLVAADATIPLRRSVPLSAVTDEVEVKVVFSPDVQLALLKLPVQDKDKAKLYLGVHIHRDGSSHFTLSDKTSGKSVDALIKP